MHLPARFSALALAGALLLVPVEAAPALAAPAAPAARAAAAVTAAPARLASATSPASATLTLVGHLTRAHPGSPRRAG